MKGEDRFVERLRASLQPSPRVWIGPGDDAAVIAPAAGPLVATTDLSIEGVDFLPGARPEVIGRRAFAVNLSDLAAMGARPDFFLLSIGFPRDRGEEFPLAVARGALSRADPLGARLVGGDLSQAPATIVSIALWGVVERQALTRSGARPGDLLFLSGFPGRAAAGLTLSRRLAPGETAAWSASSRASLSPEEEADLLAAHGDPEPRLELGLFLAREAVAHAAIDVSDGLGIDAARLARASGVRVVIERERIPVARAVAEFARVEGVDPMEWILAGGDDYELLFAAPPEAAALLGEKRPEWGTAVTRIGRIEEGSGAVLSDGHGERDISELGYDHLEDRRGRA